MQQNKKNKKNKKNKVIATAAMIGAVIAVPTVVDAISGDSIFNNKAAAFDGGTGTAEDPYLVGTQVHLDAMRNNLSAHYKLTENIDLQGFAWMPIGTSTATSNRFSGTLDGAGFTISNLTPITTGTYQGLFGFLNGATIKNLTLDKPKIQIPGSGTVRSGALFANSAGSLTIDNVHVTRAVFSNGNASADVGGLGGRITGFYGSITNVTIDIDAQTSAGSAGGVFASITGATSYPNRDMSNISVKGLIRLTGTTGSGYGGVAGDLASVNLSNIVTNVDVQGYRYVGGVIGKANGEMKDLVLNKVFAYGSIVGPNSNSTSTVAGNEVGGIIGTGDAVFRFVYAYNKKVEGNNTKGTVGRLVGKDLIKPEMYGNAFEIMEGNAHSLNVVDVISQSEVFVKAQYEQFGFDFENIWTMVEGQSAPRLQIQNVDTTLSRTAAEKDKYSFAGGSGTISSPYLIANADDFRLMATNTGAHFRLMANIDLDFSPLQPTGTKPDPFTGSFDGNGFTISNVNIASTTDYVGIFGYTDGAKIKNVTINNANVLTNGDYVGALIGFSRGGSLTNIHLKGDTNVTGTRYVGGVVGRYDRKHSKITEYHSKIRVDNAVVRGTLGVGGLMGYAKGSSKSYTIKLGGPAVFDEVFINAKVVGTGNDVGGFSGTSLNVVLKNAVILGSVEGLGSVGGITNAENGVYTHLHTGNSQSTTYYYDTLTNFENVIVYNHVKGAKTTSTSIGGGFGEFNNGSINGVFLYNSSVDVGKVGSISKSWGTDVFKDHTVRKSINGIFQYETIPGAASVGYVDGIVDANMVKNVEFYKANSTMDFGGKWTTAANGHPALSFNPKQADHTFTTGQQESSQFAGGTGTVEDPFLVANAKQFDLISSNLTANFKLVANIDFDDKLFTKVIGTTSTLSFKGVLDGNGYALRNINLQPTAAYQGIFGYVADVATIKNLKIENAYTTTKFANTGILAGRVDGTLENITIDNVVANVTAGGYFGAVAGRYSGAYTGKTTEGIVNNLTIKNVKITSPTTVDYLGGAFGTITTKTLMQNIYVDAVITGGDRLGIFTGSLAGTGTYTNVQTTGSVTGGAYLGGYAGSITAVSFHNQIVVAADLVGGSAAKNYVGGVTGSITSATAKFTGIYSLVKRVQGTDTATVGKVFGKIPTGSSFLPLYVNALSTTVGGHSTSVTTSLTEAQILDRSYYTRSGMFFNETSDWEIADGAIPNLKTSKVKLSLGSTAWSKTAINADAQSIATAQGYIDQGFANKNLEALDLATIEINKIEANITAKNNLVNQINEVKKYIKADNAIKQVWRTFKTAHYNVAITSIAAVANPTWRATLTAELGDAQATIAEQTRLLEIANTLIDAASENKTDENTALAQSAVDAMRESEGKRAAQERLDSVVGVIETRNAVEAQIIVMESSIASANARLVYSNTLALIKEASSDIDVTIYEQQMIQIYIELQKVEMNAGLFSAATIAVTKLEGAMTTANLTDAQNKVNLLPNGQPKTMLQDRIDVIQAKMGVSAALDVAIEKTSDSMLRVDYDEANVLFKKLVIAADITKYTPLLSNLNKLVESAEAVTSAETTPTQALATAARTKLNATPKTYANWTVLDARLTVVETAIANEAKVAAAEAAVVLAEQTLLKANIDSAQALVTALTAVPDKQTEFNARLEVARSLMTAKAQLDTAKTAVTKAETTKTRADVAAAQITINSLPTSVEREELQGRLDAVLQGIVDEETKLASINDATNAVVTAETTKTKGDINTAQAKVTALPASDIKTSLQNRLDVLKAEQAINEAIDEATRAVVAAETTKSDADIATAQAKVTALPADATKQALQARIDKLIADKATEKLINEATAAVVKAEGSKTNADINDAQAKVTALPNGADKTALQARIDRLNEEKVAEELATKLAEATAAVVKAEGSKTDGDIVDAQTKVLALPGGVEKTALQARIDALKAEINASIVLAEATAAVAKAEGSKTDADISTAQAKVTALPNGTEKTALQARIDAVRAEVTAVNALNEATTAVENAERTKTSADIADAQTKVTALPNSTDKTALQARLDNLKAVVENEEKVNEARAAVVKAEGSKTDADIAAAQTKVTALPNGSEKTELQARLDKLVSDQNEATALMAATTAVVKAEGTRTQTDIDDAQAKVNAVTNVADRAPLQQRLDALVAAITNDKVNDEALRAVVQAETTRGQADIATAQTKVDEMNPGEMKDALQARIDAIKTANESDVLYQTLIASVKAINKGILDDVIKSSQFTETRATLEGIRTQLATLTNVDQKEEIRTLIDATIALMNVVERIEAGDKTLIGQLPDSVVKDKFEAENNADIDNANYAAARTSVEYAESVAIESKRAAYVSALALVDKVVDSERKTALEQRLAAILSAIEAYEAMDGGYVAGDSVLKVAQTIKTASVKTDLVAWAKAVEDAEFYNSTVLVNALVRTSTGISAELLANEKYANLIAELQERTAHIIESGRIFTTVAARDNIKRAYIAIMAYESDRTAAKKAAAQAAVAVLEVYANSASQIAKLHQRIDRINVIQ